MMSDGLQNKAQELGLWDGEGEFHFAHIFSGQDKSACQRFESGSQLLTSSTASGNKFNALSMFQILRDESSGICMRDGAFISTSSMVVPTFQLISFPLLFFLFLLLVLNR